MRETDVCSSREGGGRRRRVEVTFNSVKNVVTVFADEIWN